MNVSVEKANIEILNRALECEVRQRLLLEENQLPIYLSLNSLILHVFNFILTGG